MDAIDRALMEAWSAVTEAVRAGDRRMCEEVARRVREAHADEKGLLRRPVRSWCLVLRADDRRIWEETQSVERRTADAGWDGRITDGKHRGRSDVRAVGEEERLTVWTFLDAGAVRRLCAPVEIPEPGLRLDEVCAALGVSRGTVTLWARPVGRRTPLPRDWHERRGRPPLGWSYLDRTEGRVLVRDRYASGSEGKLSEVRYWARRPVDPSGEVWALPEEPGRAAQREVDVLGDGLRRGMSVWAGLRRRMLKTVPEGWGQWVVRRAQRLHGKLVVWKWVCGACGGECRKLYWPCGAWNLIDAGREDVATGVATPGTQVSGVDFVCRGCAGLAYESVERGRERVAWDHFVRRVTGGVLRGREVMRDIADD